MARTARALGISHGLVHSQDTLCTRQHSVPALVQVLGRDGAMCSILAVFRLARLCATNFPSGATRMGSLLRLHVVATEGHACGSAPLDVELGRTKHSIGKGHRSYMLVVPTSYQPTSRTPLVLLGPGSRMGPSLMLDVSDFESFATAHGVVVAVLVGATKNELSVRRRLSSAKHGGDAAYLEAVVNDVSSRLCIDPLQVSCAGFSRGARFCSKIGASIPNALSAVVAVSGLRSPRELAKPTPVLTFHGTADGVNPYHGGGPKYWGASVPSVVEHWRDLNQCQSSFHLCAGEVEAIVHSTCAENADVILVLLHHAGHHWPRLPDQSDANAVVWAFLEQHSGAQRAAPPTELYARGSLAGLQLLPCDGGPDTPSEAPPQATEAPPMPLANIQFDDSADMLPASSSLSYFVSRWDERADGANWFQAEWAASSLPCAGLEGCTVRGVPTILGCTLAVVVVALALWRVVGSAQRTVRHAML